MVGKLENKQGSFAALLLAYCSDTQLMTVDKHQKKNMMDSQLNEKI